MNPVKFAVFGEAYLAGLKAAVLANPVEYAYDVASVPVVVARMLKAMEANPYGVNYAGGGFKKTCKALGIKATRKAIFEFLEVEKKS